MLREATGRRTSTLARLGYLAEWAGRNDIADQIETLLPTRLPVTSLGPRGRRAQWTRRWHVYDSLLPLRGRRGSSSLQESQTERREHQDDPDVHHQALPEPMPEEQDVHADHDGYQREDVKHDADLSSHRCTLLRSWPRVTLVASVSGASTGRELTTRKAAVTDALSTLKTKQPAGHDPDEVLAMLDAVPDLRPALATATEEKLASIFGAFDVEITYDRDQQTLKLAATITPELIPDLDPDENDRPEERSQINDT